MIYFIFLLKIFFVVFFAKFLFKFFLKTFCRTGDKHLDSSSDSEIDMPSMMMVGGPNNQSSNKLSLNPSNANLPHNHLLLQQGQLGK